MGLPISFTPPTTIFPSCLDAGSGCRVAAPRRVLRRAGARRAPPGFASLPRGDAGAAFALVGACGGRGACTRRPWAAVLGGEGLDEMFKRRCRFRRAEDGKRF